MPGSRAWKIQMRLYHNPRVFSYPVNVHKAHEVGQMSIQERGSPVSSVAATVNLIHPEYNAFKWSGAPHLSETREQGQAGGRAHHHSFCCFTCPTPWHTNFPAAVNPAELLSEAMSIAGVSFDRPLRHSLGTRPYSLALRTLF